MGDKKNLRDIWRSTDKSYLDALGEVKKPLAGFDNEKKENLHLEDSDSDSRSTSSTVSELYAAIPNEFRPKKATTSSSKTFGTSNAEQRVKKIEGRVKINRYNDKKNNDEVSVCDSDVVIERETKNMIAEKHLTYRQHLEQQKPSATADVGKTMHFNLPPKSPDNRQFSPRKQNVPGIKNIKYRNEIAKLTIPAEPPSVSKGYTNFPEKRYEFINNDNCTKLKNLRIYEGNEQIKNLMAKTSKEYISATSCGISKLFVDCTPEDDSGFIKPPQNKTHKKLTSEAHVLLPFGNENKGHKNNHARHGDSVNFNDNRSSENNLSKTSKTPFLSSDKEESITYNVVPKQIECEFQKQSFDNRGNKNSGPHKKSPVITIEHKCYINNCRCDQKVKEEHHSTNTIPNPDRNRNSDSVKNNSNFYNKQPFSKNRNFNCRSNNYSRGYKRNRGRRTNPKCENTFQKSLSNSSKRDEHTIDASSSNKTREKRNNNSKNTNFNNASCRSRSRKSQDLLYSIRSSECPSTSSNSSSDDDDDARKPIQYRHILPVDSNKDQYEKRSSKTEEKVTYGEKIVHCRENYCSQNDESNIGIQERDQETTEISETKTYVRGRLLHKVTRIKYKEVKTNARELPETIISMNSKGKKEEDSSAQPITRDNSKKSPNDLQRMNYKHTITKWDSNLTFSKKGNRKFFPRKPFCDNFNKPSYSSTSTKGNSSQFRSVNETAAKASQNQTETMPHPISEIQETDTFSFSYVARKSKDNSLHRSQSKCRKSTEECYDFHDKFIKNEKSQHDCNFEEFKSVINGVRRKNPHNFFERKYDSTNEIIDATKRKLQQTSNNPEMLIESHPLSPGNNMRDKLSDPGTKDKEEPVEDITQTHALKSEIHLKQTHEFKSCAGEGLLIESEILTKRNILIHYGKEISNFILGSHFAIEELLSLYTEWSEKRQNTLLLLRTLSRNVTDLKNVPGKGNEIMKQIKLGADVVSAVPVPYVQFIGRLISVVTSIVSAMMLPSSSKTSNLNVDELGITLSLQQDLEVSLELYRQCLVCDQQFQNTCEFIEEFHLAVDNDNYKCLIETSPFLDEITGFKPGNNTYYKRLKKAIEKAIQARLESELEISYCQPFFEFESSLNVVDKLDWRFRAEGFNPDSLENRWEELSLMILSYDSLTFDDIVSKIQNSVKIFGSEELAVKRSLARFQ